MIEMKKIAFKAFKSKLKMKITTNIKLSKRTRILALLVSKHRQG